MLARQKIEQRRLPGAVRSDEPDDFARADRKRDAIDGGDAAETLDQSVGDENGRRFAISPARASRRHRFVPAYDFPLRRRGVARLAR